MARDPERLKGHRVDIDGRLGDVLDPKREPESELLKPAVDPDDGGFLTIAGCLGGASSGPSRLAVVSDIFLYGYI
jgi:hypothetical protein